MIANKWLKLNRPSQVKKYVVGISLGYDESTNPRVTAGCTVPARELTPTVEAKANHSEKVAEHKSGQEASALQGMFSPQVVSQPAGSPLPQIQAARLTRSDTSKTSRSAHYVLQLQRRYGNRYVQRMLNLARQGETHEVASSGVEGAINRSLAVGSPSITSPAHRWNRPFKLISAACACTPTRVLTG